MTSRDREPNCPLCGMHSPVKFLARDRNRRVSTEDYTYRQCDGCGLIFLDEPPTDPAKHYPPGYVSLPRSQAHLQQIAARSQYQIDMLRQFVDRGHLLEIGPGYGSFLWLARRAGFTVEAIEADAAACDYLAARVGVPVTKSDTPEQVLASGTTGYDAVVMWHSLEHLPDPWATLRAAARRLNRGGVLLVATPNPSAWQFQILGRRWPHIDAPRHLWLIPLDVLRGYLEPLGVELTFATSSDAGARSWNRFGWSQALLNLQPAALTRTLPARAASRAVGHLAALLAWPWEGTDLRGSAYSAVFRKRA